jgi:putative transcriptional regulator
MMNDLDKILKVKPSGIELEKGKLLISVPFLHDYFFGHSVVLMTEHLSSGSMGFIINKPTELFVADMIEGFPDLDMPLYTGGPVQTDSIFILHKRADLIDDSSHIINDLYWGGDFTQIQSYLHQGIIKPNEIRFFLGYSGWEDEQLDIELMRESWIIAQLESSDDIFDRNTKEHWYKVVKSFGNKYMNWLKFPENPSDN